VTQPISNLPEQPENPRSVSGKMLRLMKLLAMLMAVEATEFYKEVTYENTDCTGTIVKEKYEPSGTAHCADMTTYMSSQGIQGNWYSQHTCNGTHLLKSLYNDSATCSDSTKITAVDAIELDACHLDDGAGTKISACATVSEVAVSTLYSDNCSSTPMMTSNTPTGCVADGDADSAASTKIEILASGDIKVTSYNTSYDCTGTIKYEALYPCGGTCVNGSAIENGPAFFTTNNIFMTNDGSCVTDGAAINLAPSMGLGLVTMGVVAMSIELGLASL